MMKNWQTHVRDNRNNRETAKTWHKVKNIAVNSTCLISQYPSFHDLCYTAASYEKSLWKKNLLGKLQHFRSLSRHKSTVQYTCTLTANRFSGLQVLILIAASISPKSFPLDVSPLPKSPRGTSDKKSPFPYRTSSSLMLNYPLSCPLIIIAVLQIAIKF